MQNVGIDVEAAYVTSQLEERTGADGVGVGDRGGVGFQGGEGEARRRYGFLLCCVLSAAVLLGRSPSLHQLHDWTGFG